MKLSKRFYVFVLMPILLFITGCTPATMNNSTAETGSSLRYVWVHTYNALMPQWRSAAVWVPFLLMVAIMLAGLIIAGFAAANGGAKNFFSVMLLFVVIASFSSRASYKNIVTKAPDAVAYAADEAADGGIRAKKEEVAMIYFEPLNYQFMTLLPNASTNFGVDSLVVKVCHGRLDGASNCAPFEHVYYSHSTYTETCTKHDDGSETCVEHETKHYQHDPDVKYLVRYAAQSNLPDKYATVETNLTHDGANPDKPLWVFSEWMLPHNYDQLWFSNRATRDHHAYGPHEYTPPSEWAFYGGLQAVNIPMGATSWHQYSNPLLATANSDFVGDPAVIAQLEAAGLLLHPRDLYSPSGGSNPTYFDYVYPLGSIRNAQVDWAGFSDMAQKVNMYYGNVLHISNTFAFVHERDLVANGITIDSLVYNIKADMYRMEKWQKFINGQTLYNIMQQNQILVTCVVSETPERGLYIEPAGCRVMSGLPIGNEALKQAFLSGLPNELQDIPFTPQGFFGNPSIVESDGQLAMTGTQGSPMYLWEVYGAQKPSMDENFGYLIDSIVLTETQIQQVIDHAVSVHSQTVRSLYTFPIILLVIEGLFLLMLLLAALQS